ncbi:MAG: 2-hydroxyacyl-CoA dehydratase [Lachnospiraceae bacterium]|nr:2-hydroxyacyl-CoA dehydratase [Lachnospiraceae bacterium]
MSQKGQIWKTRPLDSWAKAKELRAKWQKSISSENNVVGQGNCGFFGDWSNCFPNLTIVEDNPDGAMICSRSSAFARKSRLACEVRGWGREVCGYHNNCWGGQYLGYDIDGKPFPYRQLVVPFPCVCDSHAKRGVQVRDFEPVPQWMADQCMYIGPRDEAREEAMLEHRAYCTLRQINDIERIFDQKFDDEKLIEEMNANQQIQDYATEISILMTNKPAPISVKELYSFYTLGGLTKVDPEETVAFWRMLRDEIAWRVDEKIAAVGNERFRWIEAHPPAWHYLKYYRYMEKYGAVCLGSQYTHAIGGNCLEYKPDGSIYRRDIMQYSPDTPIQTREDAVRFMMGPDARTPQHFKQDEYMRPEAIYEFAKIFQADGAVFGLWRSGIGCTMTRKEQAMRLRKKGLSAMTYEGSQPGDRTDLDEKRFLEQLDSWMESQGLEKLED